MISKNKSKIAWLAVGIIAVLGFGGYVLAMDQEIVPPFGKVIDPHDPEFDIKEFRYSDYKYFRDSREKIADVLRVSFPQGSNRLDLEKKLIGGGGIIHASPKSEFVAGALIPSENQKRNDILKASGADYYIIYTFSPEPILFSLTPSGGDLLTVYYDHGDNIVLMMLGPKQVYAINTGGK